MSNLVLVPAAVAILTVVIIAKINVDYYRERRTLTADERESRDKASRDEGYIW